jgi:hypothetical protein
MIRYKNQRRVGAQSLNHAACRASTASSRGKRSGDDNMRMTRPTKTGNLNSTGRASAPAPGLPANRDASAAANLAAAAKDSSASREKSLDEALECTFPASDPVASMNFTR